MKHDDSKNSKAKQTNRVRTCFKPRSSTRWKAASSSFRVVRELTSATLNCLSSAVCFWKFRNDTRPALNNTAPIDEILLWRKKHKHFDEHLFFRGEIEDVRNERGGGGARRRVRISVRREHRVDVVHVDLRVRRRVAARPQLAPQQQQHDQQQHARTARQELPSRTR